MFEQGVIRPPSEADSLLVRVTRNRTWNRCHICPAYKGKNSQGDRSRKSDRMLEIIFYPIILFDRTEILKYILHTIYQLDHAQTKTF